MLMNVQLETGTFAEMAGASILWGPSSVSVTKATRWLQMAELVWVSPFSARPSKEHPRDQRIMQALPTAMHPSGSSKGKKAE